MKLVKRELQSIIEQRLFDGKTILLIGARQVGKSTLLEPVVKDRPEQVLRLKLIVDNFPDVQLLEMRLVYGSYPDVLNHREDAHVVLSNLSGSYLYLYGTV